MPERSSVPLTKSKSYCELHQGSPFDFHWKILPMVCQFLVIDSRGSLLLVVVHAAIATKNEEEMQVETGRCIWHTRK